MRIIFATYNPGKMDEVRLVGQSMGIDVVSLSDVGVEVHFSETGSTFEDNARLKLTQAIAAMPQNTADWVAADDSGIMIDALGGEPGVKTRRWIGKEMTDEEIASYALKQMQAVPNAQRGAHFKTVVAAARAGQPPLIFEGELDGSILLTPDKDTPLQAGLPFGQIFFVPEANRTIGQLEMMDGGRPIKTHRQRAFTKLFSYLNDLQSVTGQFE